jgi:tRNA 5-methylaminomethyl-2-thiouridine biosynthesis bifunctional protein
LHRLPLQAIGGRVSRIDLPLRLRAALAGDGTLLQADDTTFVGATYEPDGEAPLDEARAHAANVARLARLLATPLATGVCGGFAGIRCAARDRQPYVGAVADEVGCAADAARLQGAQLVDLPRRAGLYISAAFGSRGLLLAPLAAELIAAQAEGEPWPVERALAATLDPARYVLRQLRRPA